MLEFIESLLWPKNIGRGCIGEPRKHLILVGRPRIERATDWLKASWGTGPINILLMPPTQIDLSLAAPNSHSKQPGHLAK
jgi:hypothetical protein